MRGSASRMPATLTAVGTIERLPVGRPDARVLLVHGGERGDAEPLGRHARKTRTRVAVAARAERRPGDEQVGPLRLEQAEQLVERLVLVLAEVVVAAGERRDDLDPLELRRPARGPGPTAPVEARRRRLRGLLAAQAGEELVEVVDRSHHAVALSACWPIWFVAPR